MHTFFYSLVLPCFLKSFLQRSLFLEFTSLHSNRFHGKFRCLSHAKSGARAKKRKGGGREGKRKPPLPLPPLYFFCSHPNFLTAKTSEFATETLATQVKSLLVPELYRAIPSSVGKNTILG